MFRRNETPISLFSFQDIITCLTGIMLFLLLILTIRILEIKEREERSSPFRAETEELIRTRELMRRQLAEMGQDAAEYRKRLNAARRLDATALSLKQRKLERELDAQRRRLESIRLRSAELRRQLMDEKQRSLQLDLMRRAAATDVKNAEEMEKQNRELRKQAEKIREEIKRRRRTLKINVPPGSNRKPLVIECSGDSIRIVDIKGERSETIRRTTPFYNAMADELLKRLKKYDAAVFYFAVLMRPSSAPYAVYLQNRWGKDFPVSEYGFEPILESEGN